MHCAAFMMYVNVYRRITVHTDLIRAFDVTPSKCLCMRSPRTIVAQLLSLIEAGRLVPMFMWRDGAAAEQLPHAAVVTAEGRALAPQSLWSKAGTPRARRAGEEHLTK